MIPAANAAATWWANKVCSPTFDNGDSSDGGVTSMLGMLSASLTPYPSNIQLTKMIEVLGAKIDERLAKHPEYGFTLHVDYGPDPMLYEVANEVGISTNRFPWKTTMWINLNYVTASVGYHGRTILIWASEEWLADRPVCTSQKYDESRARKDHDYHGDPWSCSLPVYHSEDCKYDQPLELCKTCDHPKDFWHDKEQRSYSTDFHEFVK